MFVAYVEGPDHTSEAFKAWCEMNGYDPADPTIQDWWDKS